MEIVLQKISKEDIIGGIFVIPEGTTTVGSFIFDRKTAPLVEMVVLADSVKDILPDALHGCINLKEVVVGEKSKLSKIGTRALAGTAVENFNFPEGVHIGSGAFRDTPMTIAVLPEKCFYFESKNGKDSPVNSFGKGVRIFRKGYSVTQGDMINEKSTSKLTGEAPKI